MNKEQQELLDEAYKSYENYCQSLDINDYDDKDTFIKGVKLNNRYSNRWGLKIEERELSLEERLEIADKFNPLIREDCLTKTHHPDETEELKLIYRHEWLDSLGPNVVPQRKLITVTYKDKTIESYE